MRRRKAIVSGKRALAPSIQPLLPSFIVSIPCCRRCLLRKRSLIRSYGNRPQGVGFPEGKKNGLLRSARCVESGRRRLVLDQMEERRAMASAVQHSAAYADLPRVRRISFSDLRVALAKGFEDFREI